MNLSNIFTSESGANRFVDRGDPSAYDWDTGDFTLDASWRDLDCSSVVPSNAVAIRFGVISSNDTAGEYFRLRKNGNSNARVSQYVRTQVGGVYADGILTVPCDSNQIVEYWGSTGGTFSVLNVVIVGWFT